MQGCTAGTNKQHKPAVVSAGQAPAPYEEEKEDSEEAKEGPETGETAGGEKLSRRKLLKCNERLTSCDSAVTRSFSVHC